ncbi:MAG: PD40 domain-containing protein [Candidatus Sungbacteria bacterium]|nr:PD40 domain-containing protein [Candidatus Sungbacteria bacterium]
MQNLNQKKRIIYGAAIIIILGAAGFLAYRYLVPVIIVRPGSEEERLRGRIPGEPGAPAAGEAVPEAAGQGEEATVLTLEKALFQITDFPVVSPETNKTGNKVMFYKKEGGGLYEYDISQKKLEKIAAITVVGLVEALWSPVRDRAAVLYADQEVLKGFLHINASSTSALPEGLRGFSWSPDGKNAAYLGRRNRELNLSIADSSGRNARIVFSTPILDSQIEWITNDVIVFQTAPSGLAEGYAFVYSRATGLFTKLFGPLYGFSTLWSPDGSRVFLSTTNAAGKDLRSAVYDRSGKEVMRLPFQTLPEKCRWADAENLYCAAPAAIPASAILPDDYLRGEYNSLDQLVRVNIKEKSVQALPLEEERFDASDIAISPNQAYLFFVNRFDGTLWGLKIR